MLTCFLTIASVLDSPPAYWSIAQVGTWLTAIGLGDYEASFKDSRVNGDLLGSMSDATLAKLIASLDHRALLISARASLFGSSKS
jgi:hypothetical protein